MRIGVIGGCGFVGSHVVDALVAAGHEVGYDDECSSCWLAADGDSPRFANSAASDLSGRGDVDEFAPEVVIDSMLRHPLGRELGLYQEALDRARTGLDLAIRGVRHRTLRRFVVVSSLEVLAARGPLGAHLRSYREALAHLHRPPHLDVEFVHLPELYGPRQLPEAGDVAAAICGAADVFEAPTFGHLGYVGEAAALIADRATRDGHRRSTEVHVSAPVVDSEVLYRVLRGLGEEEAASRAVAVKRPTLGIAVEPDLTLSTPLAEGVARALEFYSWVAAEEETGR